ncbi:hypothetical protein C7M84_006935 [Penaeus vannamei]|uniref:Uncharacterized protein n=1 Tax=Penaeus vannamei TaxID=6689 RepID=A0A3R7M6U4_PENVA|nr:hypothetical protein C7M84_006935 [Penaeus vannamei]
MMRSLPLPILSPSLPPPPLPHLALPFPFHPSLSLFTSPPSSSSFSISAPTASPPLRVAPSPFTLPSPRPVLLLLNVSFLPFPPLYISSLYVFPLTVSSSSFPLPHPFSYPVSQMILPNPPSLLHLTPPPTISRMPKILLNHPSYPSPLPRLSFPPQSLNIPSLPPPSFPIPSSQSHIIPPISSSPLLPLLSSSPLHSHKKIWRRRGGERLRRLKDKREDPQRPRNPVDLHYCPPLLSSSPPPNTNQQLVTSQTLSAPPNPTRLTLPLSPTPHTQTRLRSPVCFARNANPDSAYPPLFRARPEDPKPHILPSQQPKPPLPPLSVQSHEESTNPTLPGANLLPKTSPTRRPQLQLPSLHPPTQPPYLPSRPPLATRPPKHSLIRIPNPTPHYLPSPHPTHPLSPPELQTSANPPPYGSPIPKLPPPNPLPATSKLHPQPTPLNLPSPHSKPPTTTTKNLSRTSFSPNQPATNPYLIIHPSLSSHKPKYHPAIFHVCV